MESFVVCVTGASGVVYGTRLIEELLSHECPVDMVVSGPGWQVLEHEIGFAKPEGAVEEGVRARFGVDAGDSRLRYYENDDLASPVCSGSYRTRGVIVIPAAMATVGAVANGVSIHLIERAAEVALKEGRPLVIVARETPLTMIQLENLARLARAGARVVPAMPAFYTKPEKIEDMVDFVVGKVLDVLGVDHELYERWKSRD